MNTYNSARFASSLKPPEHLLPFLRPSHNVSPTSYIPTDPQLLSPETVVRVVKGKFKKANLNLKPYPSSWVNQPYPQPSVFWPNPLIHNIRLKPFYPIKKIPKPLIENDQESKTILSSTTQSSSTVEHANSFSATPDKNINLSNPNTSKKPPGSIELTKRGNNSLTTNKVEKLKKSHQEESTNLTEQISHNTNQVSPSTDFMQSASNTQPASNSLHDKFISTSSTETKTSHSNQQAIKNINSDPLKFHTAQDTNNSISNREPLNSKTRKQGPLSSSKSINSELKILSTLDNKNTPRNEILPPPLSNNQFDNPHTTQFKTKVNIPPPSDNSNNLSDTLNDCSNSFHEAENVGTERNDYNENYLSQAYVNRERLQSLWKYSSSHGISWDTLDSYFYQFLEEKRKHEEMWEAYEDELMQYAHERARFLLRNKRIELFEKQGDDLSNLSEEHREHLLQPRSLMKKITRRLYFQYKSRYLSPWSQGKLLVYLKGKATEHMLKREEAERFYTFSKQYQEKDNLSEDEIEQEAKQAFPSHFEIWDMEGVGQTRRKRMLERLKQSQNTKN